jgi:hypothetical protein
MISLSGLKNKNSVQQTKNSYTSDAERGAASWWRSNEEQGVRLTDIFDNESLYHWS